MIFYLETKTMKKDQSSNEGILSFFGCLEKKKQIKLPSRRHYNHKQYYFTT